VIDNCKSQIGLAGLLLVGGRSRRMGCDKATLIVNGQPLWERQLSLLRGLALKRVYLSARESPGWAPADVRVLLDQPPSRGPLSGIALALAAMSTSHLLVLAVDLPRLTAEYLQKLISLASDSKGVVPYNEDRAEPLTAIYPKEAAAAAFQSLSLEDVSMMSFVRELKLQNLLEEYQVTPEERIMHRNLNSPGDLVS
jgi:molybdopterin-guanine dinucleotide biosynthesis protein A